MRQILPHGSAVTLKSINGVLFIDEAYTLSKDGVNDYGQEAIETLLKKMEDFRDRLVVIVAGYPQKMGEFLCSNPGLESRFTRFIRFDDYHVSDLCSIFERMCKSNAYQLTQQARANLAIFLNIAFASKDDRFGNARFVRNAYEKAVGRHADRLAEGTDAITAEMLSTLEAPDIPFEMLGRLAGPFDVLNSRWSASCPQCNKVLGAPLALIGSRVDCKCGAIFRYPWWNLRPETVPGLGEFTVYERPSDLTGYDVAARG